MKSIHKIYVFCALSLCLFYITGYRILELDPLFYASYSLVYLFIASFACAGILAYVLSRNSISAFYKALIMGTIINVCICSLSTTYDISIIQSLTSNKVYSILVFWLLNGVYLSLALRLFGLFKLFEDDPDDAYIPQRGSFTKRTSQPATYIANQKNTYNQRWYDIEHEKRSIESKIRDAEWNLNSRINGYSTDSFSESVKQADISGIRNSLWRLQSELNDLEREQRSL